MRRYKLIIWIRKPFTKMSVILPSLSSTRVSVRFLLYVTVALAFNPNFQYLIRIHNTKQYVSNSKFGSIIYATAKEAPLANHFQISDAPADSSKKVIVSDDITRASLAYDSEREYFVLNSYCDTSNHYFDLKMINKDFRTYFIKHNDKCMQYDSEDAFYRLAECNEDNAMQVFDILKIDPPLFDETIIVENRGLEKKLDSPSKKYLKRKYSDLGECKKSKVLDDPSEFTPSDDETYEAIYRKSKSRVPVIRKELFDMARILAENPDIDLDSSAEIDTDDVFRRGRAVSKPRKTSKSSKMYFDSSAEIDTDDIFRKGRVVSKLRKIPKIRSFKDDHDHVADVEALDDQEHPETSSFSNDRTLGEESSDYSDFPRSKTHKLLSPSENRHNNSSKGSYLVNKKQPRNTRSNTIEEGVFRDPKAIDDKNQPYDTNSRKENTSEYALQTASNKNPHTTPLSKSAPSKDMKKYDTMKPSQQSNSEKHQTYEHKMEYKTKKAIKDKSKSDRAILYCKSVTPKSAQPVVDKLEQLEADLDRVTKEGGRLDENILRDIGII